MPHCIREFHNTIHQQTLTLLCFRSTNMMFSGLMSQCTMPVASRVSSERSTCAATLRTRVGPQPWHAGVVGRGQLDNERACACTVLGKTLVMRLTVITPPHTPLAHQHAAFLQQLVQVDGEQLKGDAEVAAEREGPERQDHAGARSLEGQGMGLRGRE